MAEVSISLRGVLKQRVKKGQRWTRPALTKELDRYLAERQPGEATTVEAVAFGNTLIAQRELLADDFTWLLVKLIRAGDAGARRLLEAEA